jgi:hypothetical protein
MLRSFFYQSMHEILNLSNNNIAKDQNKISYALDTKNMRIKIKATILLIECF